MNTSTESLRKVFSAREKGLVQLLLGLSVGGVLTTGFAYLKESGAIVLSADITAVVVVTALIIGWAHSFRRASANEKRALRAQEIMQTDPSNLRLTVLQNGEKLIIEQVAKFNSGIGMVESTIGEKVELSREEAEALGFKRNGGASRSMLGFNAEASPAVSRTSNAKASVGRHSGVDIFAADEQSPITEATAAVPSH